MENFTYHGKRKMRLSRWCIRDTLTFRIHFCYEYGQNSLTSINIIFLVSNKILNRSFSFLNRRRFLTLNRRETWLCPRGSHLTPGFSGWGRGTYVPPPLLSPISRVKGRHCPFTWFYRYSRRYVIPCFQNNRSKVTRTTKYSTASKNIQAIYNQ